MDVAVNNAGTEGKTGPITGQTAESYAATFDTNVLGVLLSLKHELRVISAQKSGSIINISSTFGRVGAAGGIPLCREQACGRGPDQVNLETTSNLGGGQRGSEVGSIWVQVATQG